ncbi:MAG: BMP family ABC transporter substrate-binding protein, partial [Bacillaceae bacterium]|nr:BMP family ABC transporter substrate-binding protein [Bacillaceae bacterium]
MKKGLFVLTIVMIAMSLLVACGSNGGSADKMKVGMVTDAGTIDDKSFNQGSWEGVLKAAKELELQERYL